MEYVPNSCKIRQNMTFARKCAPACHIQKSEKSGKKWKIKLFKILHADIPERKLRQDYEYRIHFDRKLRKMFWIFVQTNGICSIRIICIFVRYMCLSYSRCIPRGRFTSLRIQMAHASQLHGLERQYSRSMRFSAVQYVKLCHSNSYVHSHPSSKM